MSLNLLNAGATVRLLGGEGFAPKSACTGRRLVSGAQWPRIRQQKVLAAMPFAASLAMKTGTSAATLMDDASSDQVGISLVPGRSSDESLSAVT